jgi:membrane protease YdiL (CAAX protease family)
LSSDPAPESQGSGGDHFPARSQQPPFPGDDTEIASASPELEGADHGSPSLQRSPAHPALIDRLIALFEVLVCSDYPTQLALASALVLFGYRSQTAEGGLDLGFIVILSLLDTVLLIGLIVMFLRVHGERPRDLLLGTRNVASEIAAGLPLALASLAIAVALLVSIQQLAPGLHTVERNPLQDLVGTPRDAMLFALVVVVAGGVREEIQRAFLLHRFERWLGGGTVGIVVVSVVFGSGHLLQGADAAITTGVLGAFWGVIYLRRRSAVAPMVCHAGFNLLQLAQFLLGR